MERMARAEGRYLGAATAVTVLLWWVTTRHPGVAWPIVCAAVYALTRRPRFRRMLAATGRRRPTLPAAAGPAVRIADAVRRRVWRAALTSTRRSTAAARRSAGMRRAHRAKQQLTGDGWDGICREAGWCKAPDGGPKRPPSLLGVDVVGPDAVRIMWRPWNGTDPKDYNAHAAILMRSIDAQTARAHRDLTRTGVAVAHLGLRVLPTMVRLSRAPRPAGVGPDAAFWLGPFSGGGDAIWRPAQNPHLIIIGSTDKGKGGAARLIMAQALIAPWAQAWDVHFLNTKRSGETGYTRGLPWAWTHTEPRDMLDALQRLDQRRDQLQGVLEREGADKWSDLPAQLRTELHWRRVLLTIDEMAAMNLMADTSIADRIARLTALLVQQMRSVGWHMIGMTQRPDAKALGPLGGLFRSQLKGAYLVVGRTDRPGLRMVDDDADSVWPLLAELGGVQGRALGRGFDDSDQPSVLQLGWLDQPTAAAGVRALLARGVGADVMDTMDTVDMTTTPPPRGGRNGLDMSTVDTMDIEAVPDDAHDGGGGTPAAAVAGGQAAELGPIGGAREDDPLPSAEDAANPTGTVGDGHAEVEALAAGEQVTTIDALAAELEVSGRQVRRYAHGECRPPAGIAAVRWVDHGHGQIAVRRQ